VQRSGIGATFRSVYQYKDELTQKKKGGETMQLSKKALFAATLVALFALTVSPVFATTFDYGLTYGQQLGFGTREFREAIMAVINILMGFLGIVALVVILMGGFTWMTAGGNEDKIASARGYIVAGIIGLVIIFASYALITFVINSMIGVTGSTASFT